LLQSLFMLSFHPVYKVTAFQEVTTKILCEYGGMHILAVCLLPPLSTVLMKAVVSRECWYMFIRLPSVTSQKTVTFIIML
jgi:hypothetical protein